MGLVRIAANIRQWRLFYKLQRFMMATQDVTAASVRPCPENGLTSSRDVRVPTRARTARAYSVVVIKSDSFTETV